MSRRAWLRVVLGAFLAATFAFLIVDPKNILTIDLRDNLIAETLGAAFTILVVDILFELDARRDAKRARAEFRLTMLHTFDSDLHAMWSLMIEPLGREDAFRHAPREVRIERFLRELADPATWTNAPAAHAKAVRGRLRDLGEDGERMLILSGNVVDLPARATLEDLRRACRTMDEEWDATPRGELGTRFARQIVPPVRRALDAARV